MSVEESQYQLRREKLKQIEALGQQSYPRKFEFTHSIPEIVAKYSDFTCEQLDPDRVNVRVAGRLMLIRGQGKAGFAHLQQAGQRLQIYVKLDFVGEKGFQLYKLLDLGDFIGVTGYLFRTRTNELSVHVEEITFLAKDLLPLPEKYHGLSDVELRYRQRYVDLNMNPDVGREVTGTTVVSYQGRELDFGNWQRLSMREAIIKYWPESCAPAPQISDFVNANSVHKLAERLNSKHTPHMPYDPSEPAGKTI